MTIFSPLYADDLHQIIYNINRYTTERVNYQGAHH